MPGEATVLFRIVVCLRQSKLRFGWVRIGRCLPAYYELHLCPSNQQQDCVAMLPKRLRSLRRKNYKGFL